jgi:hypothetical protein
MPYRPSAAWCSPALNPVRTHPCCAAQSRAPPGNHTALLSPSKSNPRRARRPPSFPLLLLHPWGEPSTDPAHHDAACRNSNGGHQPPPRRRPPGAPPDLRSASNWTLGEPSSLPTTSPVHPGDELAGFWSSPPAMALEDYIASISVFPGSFP